MAEGGENRLPDLSEMWVGIQYLCAARTPPPKCGQWSCPSLVPSKRTVKVGFPDRLLLFSRPHLRNSFLVHLGLEEMGGEPQRVTRRGRVSLQKNLPVTGLQE